MSAIAVFFSHFLLGLSLAAPIGPINTAQMERGIRSGFWHAWLVGVGAMLADCVFMTLVYFGVIHFLNEPFMKTFLWLFGFFVLTYTGIESLVKAGKPAAESGSGKETPLKALLSGFLMSIANPMRFCFGSGSMALCSPI